MGANASMPGVEFQSHSDFVDDVKDCCAKADAAKEKDDGSKDIDKEWLDNYTALWNGIQPARDANKDAYDGGLVKDNALSLVKYAFRHHDTRWREQGIKIARTFFHSESARDKLHNLDFIGSVLLITLPEDHDDQDDGGESDPNLIRLQEIAAKTLCEMADYAQFIDSLCQTSVLNFLCIVLDKVPKAKNVVTETFVKLSNNENNLTVLTEGAVGDILEQFFSSTEFELPPPNEWEPEEAAAARDQWIIDATALGHCAHTLGTLIKYNRPSQVPLSRIMEIFNYFLGMVDGKDMSEVPDNFKLLAHMARLFYWKCRRCKSLEDLLKEACVENLQDLKPGEPYLEGDYDFVLRGLVQMWKKCVETHGMLKAGQKALRRKEITSPEFKAFCVKDLVKIEVIDPHGADMEEKTYHANMLLCYMNCSLWVFLPVHQLRWKLRQLGLVQLFYAFELKKREFLEVILGTARFLVDHPPAQQCHDFIKFFGEQFLILLETYQIEDGDPKVIRLLLDSVAILSMQRDMQEMLSEYDICTKLQGLMDRQLPKDGTPSDPREVKAIKLSVLRTMTQTAIHPSHRLDWVAKMSDPNCRYPPRESFIADLTGMMADVKSDENIKTLASLLLTMFNEDRFTKPVSDMEATFSALLDWWQSNTTTRFDDEVKADEEAQENGGLRPVVEAKCRPHKECLARCKELQEDEVVRTSMETMPFCAPHECTLALALFSRLALEPKFKKMFMEAHAIEPLLSCVCLGIWPEAREAAATLANLMWLPDTEEERLVCWLKFDGPKCITVDASNVSVPIKFGSPLGADIGKGMYKSSWGVEFVEGSCVVLHPDGLHTNMVPGILTSASPSDTFANTSKAPYHWLDEHVPEPRHFTITCWFYWPLPANSQRKNVLVHSAPKDGMAQISLEYDEGEADTSQGVWHVTDERGKKIRLKTPKLNAGWHMLSMVSTTEGNKAYNNAADKPIDGTKFYIDDWHCELKNVWVKNEFHTVGNTAQHGAKRPFGLITDFRIYAKSLRPDAIKAMVHAKDMTDHPDKVVRRLASLNAAEILAQRLDVPDSACECLRALGSLATHSSQRAKIFSVCGPRVLHMVDSPLPMIQRQAARLLNNIS